MPDDLSPPTELVVRLYAEENKSMYDIAMELGSREWVIKSILLAAGVTIRKRGGITGKKKKIYYCY